LVEGLAQALLPDGANAYPAYKNPHHCRMALTLIRPTKSSPLPDGAGAYPAYKILSIAGWRCAYPAYKIFSIAGWRCAYPADARPLCRITCVTYPACEGSPLNQRVIRSP